MNNEKILRSIDAARSHLGASRDRCEDEDARECWDGLTAAMDILSAPVEGDWVQKAASLTLDLTLLRSNDPWIEIEWLNAPGFGMEHVVFMLNTIIRGEITGTKAHRWLGWAQAAVVASGAATLEDMKDLVRELAKGEG